MNLLQPLALELAAPGFLPPDGDLRSANACAERVRRADLRAAHASQPQSSVSYAAPCRRSYRLALKRGNLSLTVLRPSQNWCGCGPPDAFRIDFLQRKQARALLAAASVAAVHCNARSPLGRVDFVIVGGEYNMTRDVQEGGK